MKLTKKYKTGGGSFIASVAGSFLLISSLQIGACEKCKDISKDDFKRLVDVIYIVEGGDKTKYPYGIKSIDTKGNKEYARKICYNTCRNNYKRWEDSGKKETCYINFLADRYCPPSVDKVGNKNWKRNVKKLL